MEGFKGNISSDVQVRTLFWETHKAWFVWIFKISGKVLTESHKGALLRRHKDVGTCVLGPRNSLLIICIWVGIYRILHLNIPNKVLLF